MRVPADEYGSLTQRFLEAMRNVKAPQEDFFDGLKAALEEIEIEIQACKETME